MKNARIHRQGGRDRAFARQTRSRIWLALALFVCSVGCQVDNQHHRSVDDLLIETIDVAGLQNKEHLDLVYEEPPAEEVDANVKLVQFETPELTGPKVNSIFEEEDVRLAIQVLSEQAEAMVIVDEMVSGTVTATIIDQPFELALQSILIPLCYIRKYHNGSYLIGSADPSTSLVPYHAENVD